MRTDEELVEAIRRGDHEAFGLLYERYATRLYSYLIRHLGDRAAAEDLLQEVFLEVLESRSFELRPGRFGGWLFTVAKNRVLGRARDGQRRAERLSALSAEASPAPAPSAEHRDVLRALARLSPPQQDVLLLKAVGGFSYREIAEIQSVPEGTAKSRLHLAIKALRELLGARGEHE
jgi:RNA polymerase sigma-70 factor (ECF subfamily)